MMRGVARTTVGVLLVLAACQPPAPHPGPPSGACTDPFVPAVVAELDRIGAGHRLTAAVFDDRSGCWYHYRQGQRVTTASVVKVEIMAGTLHRAQSQGRGLAKREREAILPMISASDDATASWLWTSLGGEPGMERVGATFGLTRTDEVAPTWGLTSTTAEDQAGFVSRLVQGPGPLTDAWRGVAWFFLRTVRHDQRWGVTAGVPAGWEVGLKNGFAPSRCCGWRVNSVGYVADPRGGGYSIAVLSDGWPNLQAGIPVVEAVSASVATVLAR